MSQRKQRVTDEVVDLSKVSDEDDAEVEVLCPKKHVLVSRTLKAYVSQLSAKARKNLIVSCDLCGGKVLGQSEVLMQCNFCSYDICPKCSDQEKAKAHSARSESSKSSSQFPVIIHDSSLLADIKALEPEIGPTYVIELAKSGRAECQKCSSKIDKDEIRCGELLIQFAIHLHIVLRFSLYIL
jgi:hypothetical protein